ncbi:hypothetical protein ACQKML_04220 [Peribacillus frigoritolerans]
MKGTYALLWLLAIMTVGGVIPIKALSPAKETVIVPASMLPNSAAKELSFSPSNGMPNMNSPIYSFHPFDPSIINSVIPFTLDIQKPYLIRQPFVQESISVLIGMTGDIRGRCPYAFMVIFSTL